MEETKKKKENDEILSRREFFRHATKKVLPLVGAIVLSNPIIEAAITETPSTSCRTGCAGQCVDNCRGTCRYTCTGGCEGHCKWNCQNTCYNGCNTTCTGTNTGYSTSIETGSSNNSNNSNGSCSDCSGSCKGSCSGSSSQSTTGNTNHTSDKAPNSYAWLSYRLVTENDLYGKTKADLRIMRNTIYAIHGYVFKSQELNRYFSKQSWYNPRKTDVSDELSSLEKRNIQFIKEHE